MPSLELLMLLFLIAAVAGWVDTLAGGGGLITVPTLLLTGMSPSMAIATNKLQGSMGTFVASLYFVRTQFVCLNEMKGMITLTFIGSVLGSWLLLQIDSNKLVLFLPFLLMAMGLYVLLSPNFNDEQKQQKLSRLCFMLVLCPLLGFYDGFFGPGTGSLMALAKGARGRRIGRASVGARRPECRSARTSWLAPSRAGISPSRVCRCDTCIC